MSSIGLWNGPGIVRGCPNGLSLPDALYWYDREVVCRSPDNLMSCISFSTAALTRRNQTGDENEIIESHVWPLAQMPFFPLFLCCFANALLRISLCAHLLYPNSNLFPGLTKAATAHCITA